MLIRIGVIPEHQLETAKTLVRELERAVEDGVVSRVDELAARLASLPALSAQSMLTEADWCELNRRARSENPAYTAEYLLTPEVCAWLRRYATEAAFCGVSVVLDRAVAMGEHVIQMPTGEEA